MNTWLLNSTLLNQTNITTTSVEDVSFDWFWLYNSNVIALWVTRNYNTIDFNTFQIPQQDWNWYISSHNRWVNFSINFAIKWTDQNNVDILYQEMITALNYKQWVFKYKPSGWTFREIIATMTWINTDERTCKYVTWTIDFNSISPFWKDSVNNSKLTSWIILSPFTIQISNTWVNSLWKIYLLFWSWNSWINNISISSNNRIISFSWSVNDWDILLIDNENKQVLLNNVVQDYDWTFFNFINWVNSLLFTIDWTINLDVSVIYPTNHLLP